MLPNRMQLSRTVEDQLKKLKSQTGITPNVTARIAFFLSIEAGYTFQPNNTFILDGSLTLDKFTWLGKAQLTIELLLRTKYPTYDAKNLQAAWASHVENGMSSIRNYRSVTSCLDALIN